jgi:PEP-CTERM motif-containing protein
MTQPRWLTSFLLLELIVARVDPASAYFVSFIEAVSETAPVQATTDLLNPSIVLNPESATVTGIASGATLTESVASSITLVEPDTGSVSDRLGLVLSPLAAGGVEVQATFTSRASEEALACFPCPFGTIAETGLSQQAVSRSLGDGLNLTVTIQSPLEAPEPPTLTLFGTSLIGMLGVRAWRRRRTSIR